MTDTVQKPEKNGPGKCTRTAPKRIWLQVSDEAQSRDEPFPVNNEGITWCADSVLDCEVEYVRADLSSAQELGRKGGKKRQSLMTREQAKALAQLGAAKRWAGHVKKGAKDE